MLQPAVTPESLKQSSVQESVPSPEVSILKISLKRKREDIDDEEKATKTLRERRDLDLINLGHYSRINCSGLVYFVRKETHLVSQLLL